MPAQLHIVTGKGGTGKTTVAAALAWSSAARGKRTLLLELNTQGQAARLLGHTVIPGQLTEVLPNLAVIDMTPDTTMHEYAVLTFHFEAIYKAVFANRMVKNFLRFVPSLTELMILGKIHFHVHEQTLDGSRYDTIVVDGPATGHALALLEAPELVAKAIPHGPMRRINENIQQLLTNEELTRVHVVTLPEEMPVNEAIEIAQATDRLRIPLGRLFMNTILESIDTTGLEALDQGTTTPATHEPKMREIIRILKNREHRRELGETELKALPASLRDRAIRLPTLKVPVCTSGIAELAALCTAAFLD